MNHILKEDLNYIYQSLTERDKLADSTVLITGAAGFLGYYLLQFFAHYKSELKLKKIIALDNYMLGVPAWIAELQGVQAQKFDIIAGDIASIDGANEAGYIIHAASIASPTFYRKYPLQTLDANIWGLRNLLDFYRERAIRGFLFFSSSEIYGDPVASAVPTPETYRGNVACVGPRACYDESKRFGETMCEIFSRQFGLPITIARPFNNYGPGMRLGDKRVVADFAASVVEGREIEILSDGSPTRTFCYVADAILGYLKALLHGEFSAFNIGMDKDEISIKRLAEIYSEAGARVFGRECAIKYAKSEEAAYLTDNPQRRCPDLTKARSLLGYDPQFSVSDGVLRFLEFLKAGGVQ